MRKFIVILISAILMAPLFSQGQFNSRMRMGIRKKGISAAASRQHLLLDWNFTGNVQCTNCRPADASAPFPKGWNTRVNDYLEPFENFQSGEVWAIRQSTDTTGTASRSVRFELRNTDTPVSSSVRTEFTLDNTYVAEPEEADRWYGLSYYLSGGWPTDNFAESILQWHDNDNQCPPWSIQIYGDVMYFTKAVNCGTLGTTPYTLATSVIKDTWFDVVIHIKWRKYPATTGVVEVWVNGVKKVDLSGISTQEATGGSYMKIGMNKFNWAAGWTPTSLVTKRIFFITNFRIGDGDAGAGYNDVAP